MAFVTFASHARSLASSSTSEAAKNLGALGSGLLGGLSRRAAHDHPHVMSLAVHFLSHHFSNKNNRRAAVSDSDKKAGQFPAKIDKIQSCLIVVSLPQYFSPLLK